MGWWLFPMRRGCIETREVAEKVAPLDLEAVGGAVEAEVAVVADEAVDSKDFLLFCIRDGCTIDGIDG